MINAPRYLMHQDEIMRPILLRRLDAKKIQLAVLVNVIALALILGPVTAPPLPHFFAGMGGVALLDLAIVGRAAWRLRRKIRAMKGGRS